MFRKAKPATGNPNNLPAKAVAKPGKQREMIPTIVTADVHLLGNLVSEGSVDFSGAIDGNIRCDQLTLREKGIVKGEITAGTVHVHGTVKGLIRAKNVHLHASCKVEGIIIHEQLSIEDGAFVDGKFKRSDRTEQPALTHESGNSDTENDDYDSDGSASFARNGGSANNSAGSMKVLENIRLIR